MKWPEKRVLEKGSAYLQYDKGYNHGRDNCRQAVEEAVSVDKIEKAIYNQRQLDLKKFEKKKINAFDLINEADLRNAEAIRKQILTELFGGEDEKGN